jgi:hypothetical protein
MEQSRDKTDGTIVGYLAKDGKWFYKKSGQTLGYRQGRWIYSPEGTVIGHLDSGDKWIYSQKGETLGYFDP